MWSKYLELLIHEEPAAFSMLKKKNFKYWDDDEIVLLYWYGFPYQYAAVNRDGIIVTVDLVMKTTQKRNWITQKTQLGSMQRVDCNDNTTNNKITFLYTDPGSSSGTLQQQYTIHLKTIQSVMSTLKKSRLFIP